MKKGVGAVLVLLEKPALPRDFFKLADYKSIRELDNLCPSEEWESDEGRYS